MSPIDETRRVAGAGRPTTRAVAGLPPARPVRRRSRARARRSWSRSATSYLDYSKHRITAETRAAAGRAGPAGGRRGAARRHVRRRAHQHHRGPARAARRPAGARGTPRIVVDGVDVVRRRARGARPDGGLRRAGALGRRGRATPAGASATSSTSASAAATSGPAMAYRALRGLQRPVADVPLRVQRRRARLLPRPSATSTRPRRCSSSRPRRSRRPRRWPTPRAARQWLLGRAGRRRRGGRPALRRGVDQRRRRWPGSASTPTNMFGFWDWVGGRYSLDSAIGLSLMVAIGPERLPRDAGRHSTPSTSTSARRPIEANAPMLLGLLGIWYDNFFGADDHGGAALRPGAGPVPGVPPAARHGEQRQVGRPGTASRWRCQTGPMVWGEPGTNGQHAFYQLLHQGTKLVPGGLHRLRRAHRGVVAEARGAPRPAGGQPPRPARGAGLRQDPRRGAGRGRRPAAGARTGCSPATGRRR